ncbi:MAG: Amino acid permease family protein [uncultured bacterium]|nr:MAG: Amino acid permease family protein [uncultured bacterium]
MDRKALGFPLLLSLVIGNMIGTGIYTLPSSLAQYGSAALIAWIYTSIGATLLAITFSNLNQRYPKTGGPYIFCKYAFGKLPGFVVAYIYWISVLVSIAGLAVSCTGYLGFIFPILDSNTPEYNRFIVLVVELAIVWGFTAINLIGIHTAGVVQLILTIIKVLPLIFISIVGLMKIDLNNLAHITSSNTSHFSAVSSAATLTFWAFIGLEAATVPAENTQGSRSVYKATVLGTLLTGGIYILSTFVLMGMIPLDQLKNSQFPFADAGTILFGSYAALFVVICAIASGLGSLNGCVLIQGQIVFAAARDRLFPHTFAKLSKHDVPIAGQLLSSALITFLLAVTIQPKMLAQFNNIALLAALLTLLTYLITSLAEIKLIIQTKRRLHKILTSKAMVIASLASIYGIWMISSFTLPFLIFTVFLISLCIPVYIFTIKE